MFQDDSSWSRPSAAALALGCGAHALVSLAGGPSLSSAHPREWASLQRLHIKSRQTHDKYYGHQTADATAGGTRESEKRRPLYAALVARATARISADPAHSAGCAIWHPTW